MYSRAYPEKVSGAVPEGYGGSAISEDNSPPESRYIAEESKNPWEREGEPESIPTGAGLGGLGIFSELFRGGRLNLKAIGFEEILIIAAAAYMLMSRDGDRECGIMLLILLFI